MSTFRILLSIAPCKVDVVRNRSHGGRLGSGLGFDAHCYLLMVVKWISCPSHCLAQDDIASCAQTYITGWMWEGGRIRAALAKFHGLFVEIWRRHSSKRPVKINWVKT